MRPAHAVGSGRSSRRVRCGPKNCSSEAAAKSTARVSWMYGGAALALGGGLPGAADASSSEIGGGSGAARRGDVEQPGAHDTTPSGARSTWPGRSRSGSSPTTSRLASNQAGQACAISASEASGPRCRAAIDHSESPRRTTTSAGASRSHPVEVPGSGPGRRDARARGAGRAPSQGRAGWSRAGAGGCATGVGQGSGAEGGRGVGRPGVGQGAKPGSGRGAKPGRAVARGRPAPPAAAVEGAASDAPGRSPATSPTPSSGSDSAPDQVRGDDLGHPVAPRPTSPGTRESTSSTTPTVNQPIPAKAAEATIAVSPRPAGPAPRVPPRARHPTRWPTATGTSTATTSTGSPRSDALEPFDAV